VDHNYLWYKEMEGLLLFMVSSKIVNDFFKWQTLKKPELVQLDKVLYRWFTSMRSKGTAVTGPIMFENAQTFYNKITSKITNKWTFFESSKKKSL
jgi:hypothetical protein